MRDPSETRCSIVVFSRNCTPRSAARAASACVNMWQSPVSSCGSRKPPTNLSFTAASAGSAAMQPSRSSTSIRHAVLPEHRDVAGGAVELGRLAEQLKRAAAALVIADRGLVAQRAQAVAAVFGERYHAALVDRVARRGAVAQHLDEPRPHRGIELRPDHQRAVLHQQPLDRLDRHAGAGPGRRIAGRYLAGVGEAGLEPRPPPGDRRP